jgi:hypothetical protein
MALEASQWSAAADVVHCGVGFPDLASCGRSQVLLRVWKMDFRVSGSIKYAFTFFTPLSSRRDRSMIQQSEVQAVDRIPIQAP